MASPSSATKPEAARKVGSTPIALWTFSRRAVEGERGLNTDPHFQTP